VPAGGGGCLFLVVTLVTLVIDADADGWRRQRPKLAPIHNNKTRSARIDDLGQR
jgi:hypothetical protein